MDILANVTTLLLTVMFGLALLYLIAVFPLIVLYVGKFLFLQYRELFTNIGRKK